MTTLRTLVFFGVVTAMSFAAHRYVFVRFVRDTGRSERVARVSAGALTLLAVAPILAMLITFVVGRDGATPFVFAAMTWMGTMLYLLLGLAVADVVRLGVRAARPDLVDGERRTFLARTASAIVGTGAAMLAGFGVAKAFEGASVVRVRVPIAKLSAAKSGYRMVQLTDVHVGPLLDRRFVERVVEQVNELAPDLVAITGDLVDGSVEALRAHVAPLAKLRARDGVFFVTGNHEYYSGVDAWIEHLATLGIRTLRNERIAIGGDDGFDLAGVDDYRSKGYGGDHGPDLSRALEGRDASRALVLLAHQPKQAPEAARLGVDLQLSGHTHAGQLRPFDWLVQFEQPFVVGLHRLEQLRVYVSAGTGFWGPPMRVGTTSEITEIVLSASNPRA